MQAFYAQCVKTRYVLKCFTNNVHAQLQAAEVNNTKSVTRENAAIFVFHLLFSAISELWVVIFNIGRTKLPPPALANTILCLVFTGICKVNRNGKYSLLTVQLEPRKRRLPIRQKKLCLCAYYCNMLMSFFNHSMIHVRYHDVFCVSDMLFAPEILFNIIHVNINQFRKMQNDWHAGTRKLAFNIIWLH